MSIDQKTLRVVKKAVREGLENKFIENAKTAGVIKADLGLEEARALLDSYADIKTRQLSNQEIIDKAKEMKVVI